MQRGALVLVVPDRRREPPARIDLCAVAIDPGVEQREHRLAAQEQREGLVGAALAVPPQGEAGEGVDDVDVFAAEAGLAQGEGAVEVEPGGVEVAAQGEDAAEALVAVGEDRVVGAEALIRWMHPERGLTGPLEFIPIAEASGQIVPITQWVIKEACRQLGAWRAEGRRVVPVSINLDASSLLRHDLAPSVEVSLAENGLQASAIEFEVTESSLMRDLDQANRTLQALRRIGVKLSIDDFGTGYSSLTYLKRFPVDVLKIDRSFVKDLPANANDSALTTAIIAMGQSLGLELVAEGVETWEQVDFLAARRCFLVQGFLFARPMPPAEFAHVVESGPAACRPTTLSTAEARG